VDINSAREWACGGEVTALLATRTRELKDKIRDVRDNKKFHFWGNAGTSKISTIHSFKGWEVESLVVCVEPQYESGDFVCSFDELIYTGFTRARTNLLLINCGNTEHRDALRSVFGSIRSGMPNKNLNLIVNPWPG
jgi:superfamily I DNA/RNA helicase